MKKNSSDSIYTSCSRQVDVKGKAVQKEKERVEAINSTLMAENERIRQLNTELYRRAVGQVLSAAEDP